MTCSRVQAVTYAEVVSWDTKDTKEIAASMQAEASKAGKTIVITQGAGSTVIATAAGVNAYSVIKT